MEHTHFSEAFLILHTPLQINYIVTQLIDLQNKEDQIMRHFVLYFVKHSFYRTLQIKVLYLNQVYILFRSFTYLGARGSVVG
jgi:hypothetical protein